MTVTRTGMTCDYCGKTKESVGFFIGANLPDKSGKVQDWTMHEGTAKTSCPDCHEKGSKEARQVIDSLLIVHES